MSGDDGDDPTAGTGPGQGSTASADPMARAQAAGGIRVHVPDEPADPPAAVIVEGATTIAVGADVPADRSGDEVPGREAADHFVEFRDRTDGADPNDPELPAGVDRIRDGGTAHVERRRRTVAPNHRRLVRELARKYDDEADVTLDVHRLHGSGPLTTGASGSGDRLGRRVQLLEDGEGVLGIHYRLPVDDDPGEVLVVVDADRTLEALGRRGGGGRGGPTDPLPGADPDVLVAPGAAGDDRSGNLLAEFDPTAYLSTVETVAEETKRLAGERDVHIGRPGTGTKTIVNMGAHGVDDHTLPISAGIMRSLDGQGVDGDRSGGRGR